MNPENIDSDNYSHRSTDRETQIPPTNSLILPLSSSVDLWQSVVSTAKEFLPEKIFSLTIHDGKLMCTHEPPPLPPRSRAQIYQDECERYSKKEIKDTMGVAQSLFAPASLKAFLVQVSIPPAKKRL
jgi:hypothetical protein